MNIKRTIELQSGRGDVLTEQNKNDYILVVGSMFKVGELTDDPDLLLDGGLIGNADSTKAVVDSQGFGGINAYTVPELLDVMCGATDVDMADLMTVIIKHSSFRDLSAALHIADAWKSNITKENTPYTSVTKDTIGLVESKPLDEPMPLPRVESIEDLVMSDAEDLMESAAILSEAAEPEVSPYQYWNVEDMYRNGEIVRFGIALWCCSMADGKMNADIGIFAKYDWVEIKEWVNSKHYKYNDHVLRHGCVYKRNDVTPKRSVNYAIFDDVKWSKA